MSEFFVKYRSRTEITIAILESARTGSTRTKILYNAYLSYLQLMPYLKLLQDSGLLEYEDTTQLYKVTDKGFKFLNMSNDLNRLMISVEKQSF